MKKLMSVFLLCAVSTLAMAQDFIIVAQPVVCMIQSDAVCGVSGSPVSIIQNEDDVIIRGGNLFPLVERDDATRVESTIENDTYNIESEKVGCYSLDGKQLSLPRKGLTILKMSGGTTRKVVK